MEAGLSEVCQDIRVGKILIQTSRETGEPELYYLRLPKDIKERHILLPGGAIRPKNSCRDGCNLTPKVDTPDSF